MRPGESLYRAATTAASPFVGWYLQRRIRKGSENAGRLGERHARSLPARPNGPLAWLHGASVGESLMLLALANALVARHPGLSLLLTSQTRTSADLLATRLPEGARHQMAPVDTPFAARRFIRHWRPDLAIMAEGEIWPNLLDAADRAGAAIALVNARMTQKSLAGWGRWPATARHVLSHFDLLMAADEATAKGLSRLSGCDVAMAGNLKAALPPPSADPCEVTRMRSGFIGERTCLVAASTHPGEERLVLNGLRALARPCALVLVPRHPERGDALAALCRDAGFVTARRSQGEVADHRTDILLADTLGELGLWFRLADLVYLGGGHAPGVGGHNPLEPVRLGRPVISGPDIFNFAATMARLERDGAVQLTDIGSFSHRLADAIDNGMAPPSPALLAALEDEAAGPMKRTLDALDRLLATRGLA